VFRLENDQEIQEAIELLNDCAKEIDRDLSGRIEPLEITGIGNFDGKVVFADIIKSESLQKIGDITRRVFGEKYPGCIEHCEWNPHLTLYKPQRPNKFRKPEMKFFEKFAAFHFGFERISEIQLCSMEKASGDDGYYFVEHSIPIVRNSIDFEESYSRVETFLTKKD